MSDVSRHFADELRATIEDFLSCQVTDEDLAQATDRLGSVRALLAGPEAPRWYEHPGLMDVAFADECLGMFKDASPFGGRSPVSPVVTFAYHPDPFRPYVTGTAMVRRPFEGPARSVHGGVVAGLFDQFMGDAQHAWALAHQRRIVAATVELTIRYHAPTPLDTELSFEASYDDVDEKYARSVATCHAREVLTASAEGRFRKIDLARFFSGQGGFSGGSVEDRTPAG